MNFIRITNKIILVAVMWSAFLTPSFAYTGSMSFLPQLTGGPATTTVTNISADTTAGEILTITPDLNFVYAIDLLTDSDQKAKILIKELPDGGDLNFSFIVTNKFNDSLIEAVVYVWAPDQDSMQVAHEHVGAPVEILEATKVSPEVTNADGNILWEFTTTSFSSFTVNNQPLDANVPIVQLAILFTLTTSIFYVFKNQY